MNAADALKEMSDYGLENVARYDQSFAKRSAARGEQARRNTQELQAMIERGEIACEWFAMCTNAATHVEPHPVLTAVPACDRCVRVGA